MKRKGRSTAPDRTSQDTAVLFDFDFTLADSSKGAIECIDFALRSLGLEASDETSIRRTIGLSLADTFERLTEVRSATLARAFADLFVQRAGEVMVDLTVLFPETPSVLREIRSRGAKTGIVSTKFRSRITEILRREGILHLVDTIVGGEDVSVHKPDPQGISAALSALRASPGRAIYVGDHLADAAAAQAAQVRFIAVLTGETPQAVFEANGVKHVVGRLAGVVDVLAELRLLERECHPPAHGEARVD